MRRLFSSFRVSSFLRGVVEAPAGWVSRVGVWGVGCGFGAPGLPNRLPRWVWCGGASSQTLHAAGGSPVGLKPTSRVRGRVLRLCCWLGLWRKLSRS